MDYRYREYQGRTLDRGVLVADRCLSLDAWSYSENESWIARVVDGRPLVIRGGKGWVTSFWVSPKGKIYFGGSAGDGGLGIHVETSGDPHASVWQKSPLGWYYTDVWGVDDDYVFAWGEHDDDEYKLALYDGTAWNEIASPGPIKAMHGIARDMVFAVGQRGFVAWWDGAKWNPQPGPIRGGLGSVFVAGQDEVYATGPSRRLVAGSIYGWTERVAVAHETYDVVKWNGEVWVACGQSGLGRLRGNTLEIVREDIQAKRLHSGDKLIAVTDAAIFETDDLSTFDQIPMSEMRPFMDAQPAHWERDPVVPYPPRSQRH